MRTKEELMRQGLPKWPQCIVTGTKIPEEQALEIIRRTDIFFNGPAWANDKVRLHKIIDILHIPDYDKVKNADEDFDNYWEASKKWCSEWGYIYLPYLYNDWILSDMTQGAQGWCNPDGTIDYHFNIGKWPSCDEVLEVLETIAKEWTFLELECTLMSEEYEEEDSEPIISFLVRDGQVEVVDPLERNIHEEFHRKMWKYNEAEIEMNFLRTISCNGSDSAISLEQIQKWADEHLK